MIYDIPACLRVGIPRDPYPPMPTPVKPFNVPPNSPAVAQQSKSKTLLRTVCPLKLSCAVEHSLQFSRKATPQNQDHSFTLSTSTYHTSPVSTLSRTLNYKSPAAFPFNDSTNSNVSAPRSVPPSPSPLLSSPLMTYRGKHSQRLVVSTLFTSMEQMTDTHFQSP